MRVAQVPRRFVRDRWGGTENVIFETSRRLIRCGHDVEVVTTLALAERENELMDTLPVRRFPYFYPYLGLSPEARARMDAKGGNLFSFGIMRHLSQQPGLDLIHLHTGKRLGGIGRFVARRRGIAYVVSLHGGMYDIPQSEAEALVEPAHGSLEWGKLLGWWVGSRRLLDDAAAIICVGHEEWEAARKRHPNQRVEHLPNGVDVQRFVQGDGRRFREMHGIPPSSRMVLTVGRFDGQKNHRLVLDVLSTLPDWHAVWIGQVVDEEYYRGLQREVQDRGLAARITAIPGLDAHSQELVDAYHSADLFLLPSWHEPFGIVLLEAWAAGCPTAASRVGGVVHLVEDGVRGRLFDPRQPDEVIRIMRDTPADRWSQWAAAGRQHAQQYHWDRITERLADLYESVRRR